MQMNTNDNSYIKKIFLWIRYLGDIFEKQIKLQRKRGLNVEQNELEKYVEENKCI